VPPGRQNLHPLSVHGPSAASLDESVSALTRERVLTEMSRQHQV
jgi:hypothetical protein